MSEIGTRCSQGSGRSQALSERYKVHDQNIHVDRLSQQCSLAPVALHVDLNLVTWPHVLQPHAL